MSDRFEAWAIVEVMGHGKFAGYVSDQALGGASFVRVDVPAVDGQPAFTKFLGAASIFAITPCTEETAKRAARSFRSEPPHFYEAPAPARLSAQQADNFVVQEYLNDDDE